MSLFGLGRPSGPTWSQKCCILASNPVLDKRDLNPKNYFMSNESKRRKTPQSAHRWKHCRRGRSRLAGYPAILALLMSICQYHNKRNCAGGDAAGLQSELERLASLAGASNHNKVRAGKKIEIVKCFAASTHLQSMWWWNLIYHRHLITARPSHYVFHDKADEGDIASSLAATIAQMTANTAGLGKPRRHNQPILQHHHPHQLHHQHYLLTPSTPGTSSPFMIVSFAVQAKSLPKRSCRQCLPT